MPQAGAVLPPVSLAVVNARVWTGDPSRPWVDGLAVRGDRLAAAGSSAEVRKLAGSSARVVDARGAFVAPGFIDSHVHFLPGGFRLGWVQLRDARTPEEFVRRVAGRARALPPGSWILGGDWDHENWGGELPRRDWLDAVTPDNPVWITRLDGHMALANGAALSAAGIDRHSQSPEGGQIVRDEAGEPTGVLKDTAMELVSRAVPPPDASAEDAALDAAMRYVAAQGVTTVHHMGTWEELAVFERAHAAGRLRTRIRAAVPIHDWRRLRDLVAERGRGDDWLSIGAVKGFVDGSLGSHTAAFLEPYEDAPDDTGLLVLQPDYLHELVRDADAAGLQIILHAIGDRAVRLQLDVFERVLSENGPRDRRWRMEHAQHVAAADRARFGELQVIASVQPCHLSDDARWAERVIGARRVNEAYSFRSLRDAGARLVFGSDWFVAPPVPLQGIFSAMTRLPLDGPEEPWGADEQLGAAESLVAYTRDAAFAAFDENRLGTLKRGMLADFVLLDRDLTSVPAKEVAAAQVLMTVVGGEVVHDAVQPND